MAEALRDWQSDVVYTTNEYGATVPVDSKPMTNKYEWNVFRKFQLGDKFLKGKGLNPQEADCLVLVCGIDAEQTIQCYGPFDHYGLGFSVAELQIYCSGCPHAQKHFMGITNYGSTNMSIWFPDFARKFMDDNDIDYNNVRSGRFVYFVTDGQYVKIGKSCDTGLRISTLQTGNARKISTIFRIYANSDRKAYMLETFLHHAYAGYRMCGEWFDIYERLAIDAWQKSSITYCEGVLR